MATRRSPTEILDHIEKKNKKVAPSSRPRNLTYMIPALSEQKMKTRVTEMLLASGMMGMGAIFALPGDSMLLQHWSVLHRWADMFPGSEARFGALIFFVGLVRWGAILFNGYWRRTPIIRIAGCMIGCMYWMTLVFALFTSRLTAIPSITGLLAVLLVFEVFCAARAGVDAFHMKSFGWGKLKLGPHRVGIN